MGRIRTIKPEFWIHEELSALSAETHMLAAGLLNYADDYGFFNPHPALIKAAVFPLRETFTDVATMVGQLVGIGYIRIGVMPDGKKVGEVCNFLNHQRVSHPTKSRYGDSEIIWEPSRNIPEDSVKAPETFRPEGKGKEGKGKEQGKEASTALAVAARKLVCTLPLNQGEHEVFEAEVVEWKALYPAVDVKQELRNIKGWAVSNPTRRKTKSGIGRFINSWLSRAQNESKGAVNGQRNYSKTGGNLDAAAQAIAFLEQADRDSQASDEVQLEPTSCDQPGNVGTGRGGLIDLRIE